MTEAQQPPVVRTLSESEIQDRLYGTYAGQKRKTASPSGDSAWTGSEILSGELQRLRSELISLRQEKERLCVRLEQVQIRPPAPVPAPKFQAGMVRWFGRVFVLALMVGALGYLAGTRVLQASPAVGDFTPYTVQVAVYNGRETASRAQRFLNELGYDAFLMEMPRTGGAVRYRVYVGRFVTKEEAAQESQRLASDARFQDFKDAFVLIR